MNELDAEKVSREAYNRAVTHARGKVSYRKLAYNQVFNPENKAVNEVLKDLGLFCRANSTTFHQDSRMHAVLEGRREVWLRIRAHLKLSEDDLFKLLGGKDNG